MYSPQNVAAPAHADSGHRISGHIGLKRRLEGRLALAGISFLTVVIYAFPWLATSSSWKTGLPPIFAPDFYAYLNFSKIFGLTGNSFTDPWYGQPVITEFNHSAFRIGFVLFHALQSVLRSPLTTSVAWSIGWSVLIAFSVWRFLREVLKDASDLELFSAASLLMFVSFDAIPLESAVYLHPFNSAIRNNFSLPFVRMFFPQIAIPLLLFYCLNLHRASQTGRVANYCWTLFLQFFAFVAFPFATVYMAFVSMLFVLINIRNKEFRPKLLKFIVVGFLSALSDIGYVIAVLSHQGHTANTATSLSAMIRIDPSQLRPHMGGTVFLLGICGLLVLLTAKTLAGVLVASLGLANLIMLLSDVVVDPHLLVSHHAGYFVHIALGFQICFIFFNLRHVLSARMARVMAIGLAAFAVANGGWASWSTVRSHSKANASFSAFAQVVKGLRLDSQDMVVAPAVFVDDASAAIPLISSAHVLYARNAEILFDRAQVNEVQRERQAIYLYLTGHDSRWVAQGLTAERIPLAMLTLDNDFTLQNRGSRRAVEADVRQNLLPFLVGLEKGAMPGFIKAFRHIVVLDSAEAPLFDASRIRALLGTCDQTESYRIRIWSCGIH